MTEAAIAQSNAALIESGYEAFARGDLQGALAIFAEDILARSRAGTALARLPRARRSTGIFPALHGAVPRHVPH